MLADFFQGFLPSLAEIIVFGIVIVAFVIFLVWYAIASRRRERRRQRADAQQRYAELARELGLSRSDEGVIDRLARYLRDPDKKYILLQNHSAFNDCTDRALADGVASEGEVAALRVRLGFSGVPAGNEPESSSEIPPDAGVLILDKNDRLIRGKVMRRSEERRVGKECVSECRSRWSPYH